jgi:ABC-type multidrug transport system fused ATPase/permease subunit
MAIHQALTGLSGQRTMLIIAHRRSTIKTADRVVVLSGGRVVESGHYDELMATEGPFSDLMRQGLDHLD